MKKLSLFIFSLIVVMTSCNNDINVFDKSADQRVADAIADLKSKLVAPANGWRLKYRPEDGSGSFYLLLDFNEDNTVRIRSDVGNDDGAYYDQTVTYRIASSLGLQVVIENYSFFSFLFEQDQASFGAEFEWIYVDETPDHALVFRSKTDKGTPTILTFEQASAGDESYLGVNVSTNLNIMADDIKRFSSAYRMVFVNKDLILYLSFDSFRRTMSIGSASKKSTTTSTKSIDFSSPYVIRGDSIVFDNAFQSTVLGNAVSMKGIKLQSLTDSELDVCTDPIPVHAYTGVTSGHDQISLEATLVDETGKTFTSSDFYSTPVRNIFHNGFSQGTQITQDVNGALFMQLYYNYPLSNGTLNAIGYYILHDDGSVTFLLKEFTPTLIDNNIVFNFAPDFSVFGAPAPDVDLAKAQQYLDYLTEGDHTYVFKYTDNIYEFFNPCNGWSFVFLDGNQ